MSSSLSSFITIENLFNSPIQDFSFDKELLSLYNSIIICDDDGYFLSYSPNEILTFPSDCNGKVKREQFKKFFYIRKIILTLTQALENINRCKEIDKNLMENKNEKNFLSSPNLSQYLIELYPKDSPIIKIFKCISKSMVKPITTEFKSNIGSEIILNEIKQAWKITIVITQFSIRIIHTKCEKCALNRFSLRWEFHTIIDRNSFIIIGNEFKIVDMRFNLDFITVKSRKDILISFEKYFDNSLLDFYSGNIIPILQPLQLSGKQLDVFMPGEKILGIFENIRYIHTQLASNLTATGRFVITTYKFIFTCDEGFDIINIPITSVASVLKKDKKELEFICKEILIFRLVFSEDNFTATYKLIERVFPTHMNQLFTRTYCRVYNDKLSEENICLPTFEENGWNVYNAEKEYKRMQIEDYRWRISNLNSKFNLCKTYPRKLVVPKDIDDEILLNSSQARIEGRIPIFTWRHPNSSFLCHGTGLVKQLKSSNLVAAVENDRMQINEIIKNSCNVGDGINKSSPIQVKRIDKPYKAKKKSKKNRNASVSKIIADFYVLEIIQKSESVKQLKDDFSESYVSTGKENILIESLTNMKLSYKKLQKLCSIPCNVTTDQHWLTYIEGTKWMDHLRSLMSGAEQIVDKMNLGSSVFLCYSELNFDRCCQLSSLAQLWMDPYYRTLKGFIVLIEKEWLSFGHPFRKRCGYLVSTDDNDILPVFIQFLDCVWQTMQQFPHHFEFNNKLLIELSTHVYSSLYGTFICNNDRERNNLLLRSNTCSIWTHIIKDRAYKNQLYVQSLDSTIIPSYNHRSLSLWTSYYLRWYQETSLVSLPRISSHNICGQDILGIVNSSNKNNEKSIFLNQLEDLKRTKLDILKKLTMEKEKLALIKTGLTLKETNERILLRKQTEENNTAPIKQRSRRSKTNRIKRNSTQTILNEFSKLLHNSDTIKQENIQLRPKTARSFTDSKPIEEIRNTRKTTTRKKKQRRYSAKQPELVHRQNKLLKKTE